MCVQVITPPVPIAPQRQSVLRSICIAEAVKAPALFLFPETTPQLKGVLMVLKYTLLCACTLQPSRYISSDSYAFEYLISLDIIPLQSCKPNLVAAVSQSACGTSWRLFDWHVPDDTRAYSENSNTTTRRANAMFTIKTTPMVKHY
jgi:hypothetical protein